MGCGQETGATEENMADEQPKKPEQRSLGEMLKSSLKEVTDPFVALVHAPRALWGVNLSYLLDGLVYFGILTELGKYLSEDVGLSDLHAGWVMSCLTAGFTLAMLFLGGLGDRVGVRKALLAAYSTLFIGRIVLAASSGFEGGGMMSPMFLLVSVGLLGMVLGGGMQQPASNAGCKQFTNEKTATMGYAMLYGLMNLGAFLSGIIAPPVRQAAGIGMVLWVYVGLTDRKSVV